MKGLFKFFHDNPLLGFLVAFSILFLNIGIWLMRSNEPAPGPDSTLGQSQLQLEIPALPEQSQDATDMGSLQSTISAFSGIDIPTDMSPADVEKALAKVQRGSEAWCDLMLVKPDNAWTEEDTRLFADSCI